MTEETMHVENQNDQVTTSAEPTNATATAEQTNGTTTITTTTTTADANNTSISVDAAAAEAAEAAKAAAAAAAEAARVAEQLAAEAAKVAEAAAAEKLRLEEEAAALKLKEFLDAQSDLFKDIHSRVPKVNPHVCVKLEELISKTFLSIDDVTNQKLNEALKDLNENCLNAFDEYISIKESANKAETPTTEQTPQEQQASQEQQAPQEQQASQEPVAQSEGQEDSTKPNTTQDTSYSTTQESNVDNGTNAESMETANDATTEMASSQPASQQTTTKPAGAKVKADVDVLSGTLFKWKRSNKDKLTKSGKIQSLLQGKNNRRSMERPGPNPEKLKEILARTGYSHEISSGQRKYGGPPPNWNPANPTPTVESESQSTEAEMKEETAEAKPAEDTTTPAAEAETTGEKMEDEAPSSQTELTSSQKEANPTPACVPPQGCECFVGKLPRDLFEDELIPVFEKHGRIWDLRLMIDPSTGFSKGYCFVTYCDKNEAQAAAKALNDSEIRPGKEIRVNISVANIKLFIGNIPRSKSKEELKTEFSRLVEGLSEVIIYNQGETSNETDNKVKNRGFCFLEFIDHKSASVAKRKLSSSRFNRVFNRELAVDWADPNDEPDEETMSKVKVLYVKNLSAEVTEEEVQKLFEQYGKLERVRKMKDYAFVHFDQREDAVKAMEEQNTKVFGKLPLEISLARPLTDKKKQAQQKRMENNNRGNHQGNGNWNNGGHYNNHRQNNNNFNQNGGNRNGNRGQMNNFNGNKNHNGNRGNFNNGLNNGHMNNNGMGRNNNNNRGFHNNNNNHFNDHNNYNNYNNNNMRNGGMNNGRGGGNFRNGNQRGGNRGGFNNGNQMLHKRKNNDNNFMNGDNNQKKGRFANQNNMNNMGNNNMDFGNQQMAGNNFMGNNNNGWNQSNFNGMQQGNDASNEFYQDNFNSNQWL